MAFRVLQVAGQQTFAGLVRCEVHELHAQPGEQHGVSGLGFRVQGLGFRVEGLRVEG